MIIRFATISSVVRRFNLNFCLKLFYKTIGAKNKLGEGEGGGQPGDKAGQQQEGEEKIYIRKGNKSGEK